MATKLSTGGQVQDFTPFFLGVGIGGAFTPSYCRTAGLARPLRVAGAKSGRRAAPFPCVAPLRVACCRLSGVSFQEPGGCAGREQGAPCGARRRSRAVGQWSGSKLNVGEINGRCAMGIDQRNLSVYPCSCGSDRVADSSRQVRKSDLLWLAWCECSDCGARGPQYSDNNNAGAHAGAVRLWNTDRRRKTF